MKIQWLSCGRIFVFLFLVLLPTTQAQAKASIPVPYGYAQSLSYLAPTELKDKEDKPLSLCLVTTKYHAFWLGFWITNDGYALSSSKCVEDSYYKIDAVLMVAAKAAGHINNDTPAAPSLDIYSILSGFSFWIALVALVIYGFVAVSIKNKKVKARVEARPAQLAAIPEDARNIFIILTQSAKADGPAVAAEREAISEILKSDFNLELPEETLRRAMDSIDPITADFDAATLLRNQDSEGAAKIIMASAYLLLSDGPIGKTEFAYLSKIGKGLNLTDEQVVTILKTMAAPQEA